MNDASREPFKAEAAHEQNLREEARLQPFPCKADKHATDEDVPSLASAVLKKNALSHISQSRSIMSYQHFRDQSKKLFNVWNGGIADAGGCLQLDHIDCETNYNDLEKKWGHALHTAVDPVSWSNSDLNVEGKLKQGSLIGFSLRNHFRYVFIGPVTKKPHMQVFLEGIPSTGGDVVAVSDSGKQMFLVLAWAELEREESRPTNAALHPCAQNNLRLWCTSHQFFQGIFAKHGPLSSLSLKVFDYTICANAPVLSVQILKESCAKFCLDAKPVQRRRKRSDVLPFGLKVPRRKRARKTNASTRDVAASSSVHSSVRKDIEHALNIEPAPHSEAEESDLGSATSESSSSSSSSTGSGSENSDCDTEGEALPLDPDHRQEEESTRAILRSHIDLEAREAHSSADAVPSIVVEHVEAANQPKTQCQTTLGLVDVGKQLAAKLAKCRHCGEKILRGSTRLAYSYSTVKFFGWIHVPCFMPYLKSVNGSRIQAVSFLNDWMERHQDQPSEMTAELQSLVTKLTDVDSS
eukprot:Skav200610  [mRNA]  locus=scaffold879:214530:216931:- [translate_table: standard]